MTFDRKLIFNFGSVGDISLFKSFSRTQLGPYGLPQNHEMNWFLVYKNYIWRQNSETNTEICIIFESFHTTVIKNVLFVKYFGGN